MKNLNTDINLLKNKLGEQYAEHDYYKEILQSTSFNRKAYHEVKSSLNAIKEKIKLTEKKIEKKNKELEKSKK